MPNSGTINIHTLGGNIVSGPDGPLVTAGAGTATEVGGALTSA